MTERAEAGAVLVVNAGSSSLKLSLLAADGSRLRRALWDWDPAATATATAAALQSWLPDWLQPAAADDAPVLIGHRVVHGGERFFAPTLLGEEALSDLEDLVSLAPLHNGPALRVMRWLAAFRPDLPQWACFDTAFHRTLPREAGTYALPARWREQGLRRYGFHGLNHQHVSEQVEQRFGSRSADGTALRLISCHLGAGCSLCAIRAGRSIATTMGFTPLEGLVMATRCGSLDPGLILHQLRRGVSVEELDRVLNEASGLLGLSGLSGSMKELRQAQAGSSDEARLAIEVFVHSLLQGIGAMAASLGGVDVIALTGGIGEHDDQLRHDLQAALAWLAPFELVRIPADEEGLIARLCRREASRSGRPQPRT
jgi:acetate kinase